MLTYARRTAIGTPLPPITVGDRTSAAELALAGAAGTLSGAAVAAMTAPDGIRTCCTAALEVESNRLKRTTAVALRRGDTLATIAASAPATMPLSALVSGRRNPTNRTNSSGAAEIIAVSPAGVTGSALVPTATAGATNAGWTITPNGGSATGMVRTAQAADGDGNGFVWKSPVGSYPAASFIIGPLGTAAYAQLAGMARDFTVAAHVAADVPFVAALSLTLTDGGGGHSVTVDSAPFLVSAGALVRYAASITMPGPAAARFWTTARWRLRVISATPTVITVDAAEVYAGPDRGPLAGLTAATPSPQPVVELTWTDPRNVNRVEVSGERRLGRITSARVQVTTDGSTWIDAGVGWGAGRLAVLLSQTYTALGVRVWVEETTAGVGNPVWVMQVDPMLVLDVSGDVVSLEVTCAREAAPGQADSPVGNFQSSLITLELDNTAGTYSPASNASYDTGHRIEAALGVIYSNLTPNPRLDVDATGWQGGAARQYPAAKGSPSPASHFGAGIGAGPGVYTAFSLAPVVSNVKAGTTYRVSAWLETFGSAFPEDSIATVAGVATDANGTVLLVGPAASTVAGGSGGKWVKLTTTIVAPANTATLRVGGGVIGPNTLANYHYEMTEASIVELDGSGNPVSYVETLPAGVYYSDPWDAPTGSTTVTITGSDRLARRGSTALAEDTRTGQTVAAIVADLALRYLDLDDDQLNLDAAVGAYVIPYAYPPDDGTLSTYLADLAKATVAAIYVDPLERLALVGTNYTPGTPVVAEIRADNALIGQARPVSEDQSVAVVVATAEPVAPGAPQVVYSLPAGGLQLQPGQSYQLVCDFDPAPSTGATVTGVVADGSYSIDAVDVSTTRAIVTLRATGVGVRTFAALNITATPLVAGSLSTRVVDQPSYDRYGPRELDVDARLIQTQAQLDYVALTLLDQFRAIDANGVRKLGDAELDLLGLIYLEVADLATVVDPASGIGGEYVLISRTLTYGAGSLVGKAVARQANLAYFAIADVANADDVFVAG